MLLHYNKTRDDIIFQDLQLFCQRELGMTDNLIQDFQLIASSYQPAHPPGMAREYMAGWCATWWDVNPFLQVLYFSMKFL